MSFNLIDLVKDQVSEQVMTQLGQLIGGNPKQNESALSSAIPGILSGLTGIGSTDKGADSLFNAINDTDDSFLDNLVGHLGSDKKSSMIESGSNILGSLLGGGNLGNLISAVSGFSGASKSNTSSLMGILAPIIFGVVKRKLMGGGSGGFDVSSLMNMFTDQKANVVSALPDGFSDSLKSSGFDMIDMGLTDKIEAVADNVMDSTRDAVENVADTTREVASEGKSMLSRLLPLAILVGAALLAYNLFFKSSTMEDKSSMSTSQMESMDAAGIGKELTSTLGTLTSSFGSITDVDSAKAALPNLTSATDKLGSLASMMEKLPEAARGPLKQIVTGGMPQLEAILNKLGAIPGVGAILKPVLESLAPQLAMFK